MMSAIRRPAIPAGKLWSPLDLLNPPFRSKSSDRISLRRFRSPFMLVPRVKVFSFRKPPIESGIYSKIPKRYQNDRYQIRHIQIPSQPSVEYFEQGDRKHNSHSADCVEEEESTPARALSSRRSTWLPKCPDFVPKKVVGHRGFSCTRFAEHQWQAQVSRIRQKAQNGHIHYNTAAAPNTKLYKLQCRLTDFNDRIMIPNPIHLSHVHARFLLPIMSYEELYSLFILTTVMT